MLTIAYITARKEPCLQWFFDSLRRENREGEDISVIVVDFYASERVIPFASSPKSLLHVEPKPNIWGGKHRITKENWWHVSAASNTAICLCTTKWLAFLDDRCVLLPGWLNSVKEAIKSGYAVCGTYEKRTGMTVENGVIKHAGIVTGEDSRMKEYNRESSQFGTKGVVRCYPEWFFGCSFALPLEWALTVGGLPEISDGLSMNDVLFGLLIANNGFPICFDPSMQIVEDRTPSELGTPMRREDKGKSPNDKSHALLDMFRSAKYSMNSYDIRKLRFEVSKGMPFPEPEKKPYHDWYDSEEIGPNYMRK
jgi:hypothetical protein